MHSPNKRS